MRTADRQLLRATCGARPARLTKSTNWQKWLKTYPTLTQTPTLLGMPALHVVARPRSTGSPFVPDPEHVELMVEGVNLAARVGRAELPDFVVDLSYALSSVLVQPRGAVTLSLHSDDDAWELGLQRSSGCCLVSVFRSGPSPVVAVFERPVQFQALRESLSQCMQRLLDQTPALNAAARSSLRAARTKLNALELISPHAHPVYEEVAVNCKGAHFGLSGRFRARVQKSSAIGPTRLERADVHSLLLPGVLTLRCSGAALAIEHSQLFLDAEHLLSVAEEMLSASRSGKPLFRRIQLSQARLTARLAPGSQDVELGLGLLSTRTTGRSTLGGQLPAEVLAGTCARFAADVCRAICRRDLDQNHNLRMVGLVERAARLLDGLREPLADRHSDHTNPEPETYRRYAPRLKRVAGKWENGPKMRFLPRWMATVPGLDLRSTFLCGDRLMVGGQRETACLDRRNGEVLWRKTLRPAASVVTPSGLVRVEPDGRLACHALEDGEVRFTARVTPRSAGGTSGSVLYGGGLPKLLALAEGDRQVSGIDLVTGEIRWRYTGPRRAALRVRRAGKLLLIAGGDTRIVGLDGATGEVVWSFSSPTPFTGDVVFDHDSAFALSSSASGLSHLHKFDPWSGRVQWCIELEERPRSPMLTPAAVILPNADIEGIGASAYDRHSGRKLWEHRPGLLSAATAWLSVDDTVVANCASGVLLGLDATTGGVRYNHVFAHASDCDQPRRLEPVLRSGALFVPQHQVSVVRPHDGEILGTVPNDLVPDLIRVDERCDVYIAEESGHLAAFGAAAKLAVVKGATVHRR